MEKEMFQLPKRCVTIFTPSSQPIAVIKWLTVSLCPITVRKHNVLPINHPTYKSLVPPPSRTNASTWNNFQKGKDQCVLPSRHRPHRPTSLHILPSVVPSTCENKPQTLECSIDIPFKFPQNCNTANSKIYLRCPSASPHPITK